MEKIMEEDATFSYPGGTIYAKIPPMYAKFIGIEKTEDNKELKPNDVKIAMGRGKHGNFLYLFSPAEQKQWQREKAREEKNQQKL